MNSILKNNRLNTVTIWPFHFQVCENVRHPQQAKSTTEKTASAFFPENSCRFSSYFIILLLSYFSVTGLLPSADYSIFYDDTSSFLISVFSSRVHSFFAVFFPNFGLSTNRAIPAARIKIEINCDVDKVPTVPRIRSPLKYSSPNRPIL